MTPAERKVLDKLDKIVLESSGNELKKIQELDLLTQMNGKSFYEEYVNSTTLSNQNIKQELREPKK